MVARCTLIALGSTRMVIGSSAIGSPSANTVKGRSALMLTAAARITWTAGWRTCVPLNTVGSRRRNLSFETWPTITTSSMPSSSEASGASSIPPP